MTGAQQIRCRDDHSRQRGSSPSLGSPGIAPLVTSRECTQFGSGPRPSDREVILGCLVGRLAFPVADGVLVLNLPLKDQHPSLWYTLPRDCIKLGDLAVVESHVHNLG